MYIQARLHETVGARALVAVVVLIVSSVSEGQTSLFINTSMDIIRILYRHCIRLQPCIKVLLWRHRWEDGTNKFTSGLLYVLLFICLNMIFIYFSIRLQYHIWHNIKTPLGGRFVIIIFNIHLYSYSKYNFTAFTTLQYSFSISHKWWHFIGMLNHDGFRTRFTGIHVCHTARRSNNSSPDRD